MSVHKYTHDTQDYFESRQFERMMAEHKHYRHWGSKRLLGRIGAKMIESCFPVKETLATNETKSGRTSFFQLKDDSYLAARSTGTELQIRFFTNEPKKWKEIRNKAQELVKPFLMTDDEDTVVVNFSFLTSNGAQFYEREIECPTWKDIKGNYGCADKIEWLINQDNPERFGKLIFWNGEPGTGKTYAIRAVLQEWKKKAEFYYVMDPEAFFDNPGYMFEVLLRDESGPSYIDEEASPEADENIEIDLDKIKDFIKKLKKDESLPVKLLILEDSVDFLLKEKFSEMGGAMGRLLNLTEGLIGQGFRLMILVTTNQEKKEVHPAFTRKGRCAQVLTFPTLDLKTAKEWAARHKVKLPKTRGRFTLGDLYAAANENPEEEDDSLSAIGFRAKEDAEEKDPDEREPTASGKKGEGAGKGDK